MMAAAKPTSLGAKVLSMVKYILLSLLAPLNGIEPLPIESESIVLPLYESGKLNGEPNSVYVAFTIAVARRLRVTGLFSAYWKPFFG